MPLDIEQSRWRAGTKGFVAHGFVNNAGRYELSCIEGDRVRYSFTNRQGTTGEASMPLATWRRMASILDRRVLSAGVLTGCTD